tara:strand:- start:3012 stop:3176 length:165 start_codon:yes stop_codon:yes gene_type:complete
VDVDLVSVIVVFPVIGGLGRIMDKRQALRNELEFCRDLIFYYTFKHDKNLEPVY